MPKNQNKKKEMKNAIENIKMKKKDRDVTPERGKLKISITKNRCTFFYK